MVVDAALNAVFCTGFCKNVRLAAKSFQSVSGVGTVDPNIFTAHGRRPLNVQIDFGTAHRSEIHTESRKGCHFMDQIRFVERFQTFQTVISML